MTSLADTAVTRAKKRNDGTERRFDPTPGKVRYSARWLGLGAVLSSLAGLGVLRRNPALLVALGLLSALVAAYASRVEPRKPIFERRTLRFPQLPRELDGLRIALIGDMHLGHAFAAENTRWAVQQVLDAQPDLIALSGDFVSYAANISELPGLLNKLQAPLGVFAVPGNHDHWEGVDEIRSVLERPDFSFLLNSNRRVEWRGARFVVAGIDDVWHNDHDLDLALAGVSPGAFTILLAHAPDVADEAAQRGVDLQLSGHTHGGHIRLPGLGALVLPRHGWRYSIGHIFVGEMQLYISRGIGGFPLRLGCPPEATLLTLRRNGSVERSALRVS
ncbi:metallophosphoesterase [Candidatus Gracilibacteria bacterium]|nr:metallophosphoesterase [Candidatus Gracilibacteria bacterium]